MRDDETSCGRALLLMDQAIETGREVLLFARHASLADSSNNEKERDEGRVAVFGKLHTLRKVLEEMCDDIRTCVNPSGIHEGETLDAHVYRYMAYGLQEMYKRRHDVLKADNYGVMNKHIPRVFASRMAQTVDNLVETMRPTLQHLL